MDGFGRLRVYVEKESGGRAFLLGVLEDEQPHTAADAKGAEVTVDYDGVP
jgi:hypothetical protein